MEVVDLPPASVTIDVEGSVRIIRSNGLPNHETGDFPTRGNPNAIRAQEHVYRVPLIPSVADDPVPARPEFGIAVNGVIFDSATGEFWTPTQERAFGGGSEWNYEALTGGINLGLDANNAHVQPTGKYHYHGVPTGLLEASRGARDDEGDGGMVLLGWAFDGYPIYNGVGYEDPDDPTSPLVTLRSSYRVKTGSRPESPEGPGGRFDGTFGADWEYVEGLGDLDEFNGRTGVTPEFPEGTFYYVITEEFPSIPRMWRGEVDPSIRQRRGPGGPDGAGGERQRRGPGGRRGRGGRAGQPRDGRLPQ